MSTRLLIVTQAIDTEDPVLGFFVRWVEEFAKHAEHIEVICLKFGRSDLPKNVRVHSLGKEKGVSRVSYVLNFYKYIWRLRHDYDTVFVHMNQEYVVLGGVFWWLMSKRILLWRNHPEGSFETSLAVFLSDRVFCTSNQSYTARFKKTQIMPVGTDTHVFTNIGKERMKHSLLVLGRVAPVKRQEIIIDALVILHKEDVFFTACFVGDASLRDFHYYGTLRKKVVENGISESVSFRGAVPYRGTAKIYNEFEVFINATQSGSLDKTIFEAMACDMLPIVSNDSLKGNIEGSFLFKENDSADLAEKIKKLFSLSDEQKDMFRIKNRDFVVKNHSLEKLADVLFRN